MIVAFGAVLNFFLIIAHNKDPIKTFKTLSSTFIFNIAIVDIFVCVFWSIEIIFNLTSPGYRVNQKAVEVLFYVLIASIGISPVLYFSLSIKRFCGVAFPPWHRVHITTRIFRKWLSVIWIADNIYEIMVSFLVPPEMDYEHRIINGLNRNDHVTARGISIFIHAGFLRCDILFVKETKRDIFIIPNISDDAVVSGRIREIYLLREKKFLCTMAVVCFILNFNTLPSLGFRFSIFI